MLLDKNDFNQVNLIRFHLREHVMLSCIEMHNNNIEFFFLSSYQVTHPKQSEEKNEILVVTD